MSKTALIYGGSGGIGCALAEVLSRQDFHVVATMFKKASPSVGGKNKNIHWLSCDGRKEADVARIVEMLKKAGRSVDVFIGAATAPLNLKLYEDLGIKEIENDIDTGLTGNIRFLHAIIPMMKEKESGLILLLGSTVVLKSPPTRMSSYTVTKYGLMGLSKSLAVELAPYDIRVVMVSPSYVDTTLLKAFPGKMLEMEKQNHPNNQLLQPGELASLLMPIINQPTAFPNNSHVTVDNQNRLISA